MEFAETPWITCGKCVEHRQIIRQYPTLLSAGNLFLQVELNIYKVGNPSLSMFGNSRR